MRRLLVLMGLLSQSAFGYASFSGWCEQGAVKVAVQGLQSPLMFQQSYPNFAQSGSGPGVTVYATGTTNKATIYSDNIGTPLGNPFPCSASGQFLFFAADSTIDALFSGTGISSFTRTIQGVDPAHVPLVADYVTPTGGGGTFAVQCAAAVSAGVYLAIARTVPSVATSSCAANIWYLPGGMVQGASGQTVTMTGSIKSDPQLQICDISLGGKCSFASGSLAAITPQNMGAVWDGTTVDTAAVAAAITAGLSSGIPVRFTAGQSKIGCLSTTLDELPLTILGSGAGTAYGANTNLTSTCTTGPGMEFVSTNGHNPHISLSGFQVTGPGVTSRDCLYIGGLGVISGVLTDISANNCKGTGFSGIHLNNVEEIDARQLSMYNNYNGMTMDGGSNNNFFSNPLFNTSTNTGLVISGNSSNNAFYSPLLQSNVNGCAWTGNTGNALYSPWFENNSGIGCTLTNEGAWTFLSVHATWPSTYFMTVTSSISVAPGYFTNGGFSSPEPGINIATVLASGSTWNGLPRAHFTGAGTTSFREVLLSAYDGTTTYGTNIPNLSTGTSSNTDQAGVLTMGGGGTAVLTFSGTHTITPICVLGPALGAPATVPYQIPTITNLTVGGPAGAVITYVCFFRD